MKIGIITHPFNINYGGILQAYSLQTFLQNQGHEVIFIDKTSNRPWYKLPIDIMRECKGERWHPKFAPFIKSKMNVSSKIRTYFALNKLCKDKRLDMLITGSDQVWRDDFVRPRGFYYFLDFGGENIKKISYAASLGIDKWNYSEEETKKIKECLYTFEKISVREQSAKILLKENLNINAEIMPDPTMLLSTESFDMIASERLINNPYIFVYWLGDPANVPITIEKYNKQGLKVKVVCLRDNSTLISISEWLSYIKYANMVITDSYHGIVFSIKYHRSFRVEKNESGGWSRIISLFNTFGLSEKLHDVESVENYNITNNIFELCREKAHKFLDI